MMRANKKLLVVGVFVGGCAKAFAAVEFGTVSYIPLLATPAPIPTLSEWTLGALSVGLAAMAYRIIRSKAGVKPLASLLVAGALLWSAVSGHPLMSNAHAAALYHLFDPAGGTTTVGFPGTTEVDNTSGVALRITAVAPLPGMQMLVAGTSPACAVGLVVPAGGSCYVNFNF